MTAQPPKTITVGLGLQRMTLQGIWAIYNRARITHFFLISPFAMHLNINIFCYCSKQGKNRLVVHFKMGVYVEGAEIIKNSFGR